MKHILLTIIAALTLCGVRAQGWPAGYGGVMLQGFYWDSFEATRWQNLEKQADDLASSFDLIWIPQSGNCGKTSMGYDDQYWFPGGAGYTSSFGNEAQLRSMIKTFKEKGLKTIADVVINHRQSQTGWFGYPTETYNGVSYTMTAADICRDDDGGKALAEANRLGVSLGGNDTGEGWDGMRDLDHTSPNVQTTVKAYLSMLLNDLGYSGFRYDMVKGYSPQYTRDYNLSAQPEFSVGECWDGTPTIRRWIDGTEKQSAAFDFQFKYVVRNATDAGDWRKLDQQNDGNWPLVSTNYENGAYRQWAVTFVENHDTEVRPDGSSNGPLRKDTLAANAYLLAMPGTPCIFLKHWQAYKPELKAMIEARRAAGINNQSTYSAFRSAQGYLAKTVDGRLLVVVGDERQVEPSAGQWVRVLSGYHYAYYLARTVETAWADKGSGTFSQPFDVTLTAVSATDGARLVYTTDGTEPSATNGTQVASGTTLHIDATQDVTLRVALLIGSTVSGMTSRTFWYVQASETKPAECIVNEGEVCAFFEAPSTWTNTVHCWAWCDSPAENFTSANGSWPGVACELLGVADNGNKVWKWTWDGTRQNNTAAAQPEKIIFNNNGQPQTADLPFQQGGYYNASGLQRVITGISSVRTERHRDAHVYDLSGRRVTPGASPHGKSLYIVNGKKVVN